MIANECKGLCVYTIHCMVSCRLLVDEGDDQTEKINVSCLGDHRGETNREIRESFSA